MKRVSVIGLGYIGLPTALLAAKSGLQVVGVDVDETRVDGINQCLPVIEEPEIVEKLHSVVGTKYFKATTECESANYFVIAVPTPFKDGKKADLSYVFSAAKSVSKVLEKGNTVILESTVPVGTTQQLAKFFEKETSLVAGKDFCLAYCPERVLPGNIFHELQVNDRIIGGINRASIESAAEFYKYFVSGDLYLTNLQEAEMVKLVENSYRDVNIAFSHQIADIAEKAGLNPYEIVELANKHPRVNMLQPTCGVGGHCLAVDPFFLVESFPEETQLLAMARSVNDNRPSKVLNNILNVSRKLHAETQKKTKILLLGLTYKQNVDDIRNSPALNIARALLKHDEVELLVCDPHVARNRLDEGLQLSIVSLLEGVEKADIIVTLVGHAQFKTLNVALLGHKKILDFCGLFYESKKQSSEQEQFFWPAYTEQDYFHEKLVTTVARKEIET